MSKRINNEAEEELAKKLREEGKTIYSISRVNTFDTCAYEYYRTYIQRNRGISNCYSEVGTFAHDYIENVYRGNIEDTSDFNRKLNTKLTELEIMDLDFPNEVIKNSFVKDMNHFTKNFNKLDGEFVLEKMFVVQIGKYHLLGYIDAIQVDGEDKVHIIDWKTSSKFSGKKLTEAGRQLLVYKLGLEKTSNIEIEAIKWVMLKYIYICHEQKNKKIKRKMVNRGKLIKEMKSAFEKEMLASGMNEIEVDMILFSAESKNSFDELPQVIKDKYWLEDCILEYDATELAMEEMEKYIINTIEEIESKDKEDEGSWKPLDFKEDGTFYCNNLCNHRKDCSFIKQYNKENPYNKGF